MDKKTEETKKTENPNMELWNSVCITDPETTSEVKKGGYSLTAICAQSQIKRATELWGSMGGKWGVSNEKWVYREFYKRESADIEQFGCFVLYEAELVYPVGDTEKRGINKIHSDIEIFHSGGKWKGQYNSDWAKKVATDALTKGLSRLGFNADVFEGKFDDNKYVQELKRNAKNEDDKHKIESLLKKFTDEILSKSNPEQIKTINTSINKYKTDYFKLDAYFMACKEALGKKYIEKMDEDIKESEKTEPKKEETKSDTKKDELDIF